VGEPQRKKLLDCAVTLLWGLSVLRTRRRYTRELSPEKGGEASFSPKTRIEEGGDQTRVGIAYRRDFRYNPMHFNWRQCKPRLIRADELPIRERGVRRGKFRRAKGKGKRFGKKGIINP